MTAPLTEYAIKQRTVIKFLWSAGLKTSEIYGKTSSS